MKKRLIAIVASLFVAMLVWSGAQTATSAGNGNDWERRPHISHKANGNDWEFTGNDWEFAPSSSLTRGNDWE